MRLQSPLSSISLLLGVPFACAAAQSPAQSFGNRGNHGARLPGANRHLLLNSVAAEGESQSIRLDDMFVLVLDDRLHPFSQWI